MTDHVAPTEVELHGRRVVVDLSDTDAARLTRIEADCGISRSELVIGWIRRGLHAGGGWTVTTEPGEPPARQAGAERLARDVEVARQAEEAFRDTLGPGEG